MTNKYFRNDLEYLSHKFDEHAKLAQKSKDQVIDQFIRMNPNEPIPDHLIDDFSLLIDLKIIVDELINLKNGIRNA